MARLSWCLDHKRTKAWRELHPKINACMGGLGNAAEATHGCAWTEFRGTVRGV